MAELHRGQHPHAQVGFLVDTGPATWGDKLEIDRTRWDERFVGELADGFNPIGQYETKGGLTLEARAKLSNFEAIRKTNESAYARDNPNARVPTTPWIKGSGAESPPKSPAEKVGGGRSPPARKSPGGSPNSPPATVYFTKYGLKTEADRQARVAELTRKLGVDKAQIVEARVDTTAQAGHNTAATSPVSPPRGAPRTPLPLPLPHSAPAGSRARPHALTDFPSRVPGSSRSPPTMRGGTWPTTTDYFQ